MNRTDGHFIRDLVLRTQGIVLSPESAQRSADIGNAVAAALDALAAGSLFDTEPAHFQRELSRLAKEAGNG